MARPPVPTESNNYRLIEGISHTLNERLILLYCKLYNKSISKKSVNFPFKVTTGTNNHNSCTSKRNTFCSSVAHVAIDILIQLGQVLK